MISVRLKSQIKTTDGLEKKKPSDFDVSGTQLFVYISNFIYLRSLIRVVWAERFDLISLINVVHRDKLLFVTKMQLIHVLNEKSNTGYVSKNDNI